MIKTAEISECGKYRYNLTREWDDALPRMLFIMLNPSTADAEIDDPTITRCINRARSSGFGSVEVVNLFAYRATDPRELKKTDSPTGVENNQFICLAIARAHTVVCAWGTHGKLHGRDAYVKHLCRAAERLRCLGKTKDGHPKHPLYIPSDKTLEAYP